MGKIILAIVIISILAWLIYRRIRYRKLLSKPFPLEWEMIVRKNVPLYNRLPDSLRKQLHGYVNVFLAEKNFEACGGLKMNEEIKVTIASQACMLLLNRKTSVFKKLHTILVYPSTYVAKTRFSDGAITIEGRSIRLGESWNRGPVVLAWDSVRGGTSNIEDARNVVLHEFAHQLDQEDGAADGTPILKSRSRYLAWARILSKEYQSLQNIEKTGAWSIIDTYGATNPAEFFAVVTETFFEKPKQLKRKHPELYKELSSYYNLDPAEW